MRFITALVFSIFFLPNLLLTRAQGQLEIVSPQDYSIKRFKEVVDQALESENDSAQEKLISYRARLVISERQLADLKDRRNSAQSPQQREEAPKLVHIRAAQAKVDHYRIKIGKLEKSILAEKSKKQKKR